MLENVCALRMLFPPDTSIDYQLNSFLLAITWQEMSKCPEKASSLPCSWHTSVPDSGSALQAWGNEENNCTLLLARNPLGYTDALFFFQGLILLSAPYCAGPSHLGAWQGSGPETWMSPELAQPGSAAGRKHSHWGNGVEQRATCEKPISIHCISMARWIVELKVVFFRSDQLPDPVGVTSEL